MHAATNRQVLFTKSVVFSMWMMQSFLPDQLHIENIIESILDEHIRDLQINEWIG